MTNVITHPNAKHSPFRTIERLNEEKHEIKYIVGCVFYKDNTTGYINSTASHAELAYASILISAEINKMVLED